MNISIEQKNPHEKNNTKSFNTAVPAISARNWHPPAPKGTLRYIHSITGPVRCLHVTGTVLAQDVPTKT